MFNVNNSKNGLQTTMQVIGIIILIIGFIGSILLRWDDGDFNAAVWLWICLETTIYGLTLGYFGCKFSYDPYGEAEIPLLLKRYAMILMTMCFICGYVIFLFSFNGDIDIDVCSKLAAWSGYLYGGGISTGLIFYALGEKMSILNSMNEKIASYEEEAEDVELPSL